MSTFSLQVITPEGVMVDEEVIFAKCPGKGQEIGIEPDHSPLIGECQPGELRLTLKDNSKAHFFIPEGLIQIDEKNCKILTPYITSAKDIDIKQTAKDRDEALEILKTDNVDAHKQAEINLKIASEKIEIFEKLN